MNNVVLSNNGPCNSITEDLYYPRLQKNKRGEIVLATGKHGTLTTGILVGYTSEFFKLKPAKPMYHLGRKFTDWEVAGELTDYDGEITVTITNKVKNEVN